MTVFKVKGGAKLKGTLTPQGAKNEALQVLCAVLLTNKEVIIENLPNILDVNILIDLLKSLNVRVEKIEEIELDDNEKKEFLNSIEAVRKLWDVASKIDTDLSK